MAGRCASCRSPLTAESIAPSATRYCRDCGLEVWAIRPDSQVDAWYEIEVPLGVVAADGVTFRSGQCGECGLGEFTLRSVGKAWDAICAGQMWDGEWRNGCEAVHPVRLKMKCEVE